MAEGKNQEIILAKGPLLFSVVKALIAMKSAVRGTFINPLDQDHWQVVEDGVMVINEQGRMDILTSFDALDNSIEISHWVDYRGHLIIPGFVDCHTHLPQLPIMGLHGRTLLDWLLHYAYPIEHQFADPTYARRLSRRFFQLLGAHGVTTAMVYASVHADSTDIAFEEAHQSGLRVIMGKVMMNQDVPVYVLETTQASLHHSLRLAQQWHGQNGGLLGYAFTPRYALSCSEALLDEIQGLQAQVSGSWIQTHIAEHPDEVAAVEQRAGVSYASFYHQHHCLGPKTVLAHGIHLSDPEWALIQQTGCGVAHCPSSNFFLGSGHFPLFKALGLQIPLGLGSDVGGGPDLSMLRVMRACLEMQHTATQSVSLPMLLYLSTLGGAKALGLAAETGHFQPGLSADFVVLTPQALSHHIDQWLTPAEHAMSLHTPEAQFSQVLFSPGAEVVTATYVRGQPVYLKAPQPI